MGVRCKSGQKNYDTPHLQLSQPHTLLKPVETRLRSKLLSYRDGDNKGMSDTATSIRYSTAQIQLELDAVTDFTKRFN